MRTCRDDVYRKTSGIIVRRSGEIICKGLGLGIRDGVGGLPGPQMRGTWAPGKVREG